MKPFAFFLQLLGLIFLATIVHEAIHIARGTVEEVGIRFGEQGGFYVQGAHQGEVWAYIGTFLTIAVGVYIIINYRKK